MEPQPTERPDVLLALDEHFPGEPFDELEAALAKAGLSCAVERHAIGPFAGSIWLLPTAAMIVVGPWILHALTTEVTRDAWAALKRAMIAIGSVRMRYVTSSRGKLPEDRPGPLSVVVDLRPDLQARFVFPEDPATYADAAEALLRQLGEERSAEGGGPIVRGLLQVVEQRRSWGVIARYDAQVDRWHLWSPPMRGR